MDWRERFGIPEVIQKTTLLCAGLLFSVTAVFIILKTARDGLFLSYYSANALPWFMALTTIAMAAGAALYIRLYKALGLASAVELCFKAFAVGTLILWAGIKTHWNLATPILYVWAGVYGALAPVQSWSVITQRLLTRQAKRDVGVIGAGGILGASVGGLFSKYIVQASGVSTLLPTATLLIIASLFAVQALSLLGSGAAPPAREVQQRKIRPRFLVLVLIVVGISSIVSTFADFQFKVIAQREMLTAERLAEFFGSFYAYIGAITLVFQLFVTPLLMSRLGVSSAMAILPLGLAVGNGWVFATGTLLSATFLKGTEQLFKHSVDRSSLEVLYMAIPDDVKVRMKSLIDTIGVRTAEGVGAGILILIFSIGHLPLSYLAILGIILVSISVVCTFFLGREYPKVLNSAIQSKDISFSGVKSGFFTTDFYNVLPDLLKTSNRETLLDLLQLLATTGNRKIKAHLEPLLDSKDAEIRLAALQLLFKQDEDISKKVELMVGDPDARIRVEAIRYLCFKSEIDPLAKLGHLLLDPDPSVQAAACACSLNLDLEPAKDAAYRKLEEMLSGTRPEAGPEIRLEVARILEHLKPSPASEQLARRLLLDTSLPVQKIALRGAANMKWPELIPALLELVGYPLVRNEVRVTLGTYGAQVVPNLQQIADSAVQPIERRKQALRILSDIDSPIITGILMQHALGSNLELRFVSIKALNRIRKHKKISIPQEQLETLIDQEITTLEVEIERGRFFMPNPNSVIEKIMQQRQQWALERIFRALGLIYDARAIYNAYRALVRGDRRRADSALEWLDTVLAPEHRSRILGLLEGTSKFRGKSDSTTRRAVLLGYLGAQDQLPAAALIADLTTGELQDWQPEIENALKLFQHQSLVEETLKWRYETMVRDDSTIRRKLSTIQKLESLGKVDIFSELGPNELLLLANQCTEQEVGSKESIFEEGETANEILILIEGSIELKRSSGQTILIHENESFGTLSVLGNQPRLFTATAVENSYCLKISREALFEIIDDYPAVTHGLFRVAANRVATILNQHVV